MIVENAIATFNLMLARNNKRKYFQCHAYMPQYFPLKMSSRKSYINIDWILHHGWSPFNFCKCVLLAKHTQLCNETLITLAGKKCADEYQIWYDLSLQPMKVITSKHQHRDRNSDMFFVYIKSSSLQSCHRTFQGAKH